MSVSYSYSSLFVLDDYIHWLFPEEKYIWLMATMVTISIFFIIYFYIDIVLQIISYWFFGPSLTKENILTMDQERNLIRKYENIKQTASLFCGEGDIMYIKNNDNEIREARTFGNQQILDCANKIKQLIK